MRRWHGPGPWGPPGPWGGPGHWHGHPNARRWRTRTLQRQIFAALVFAILAAGGTIGVLVWTLGGGQQWTAELARMESFFAGRIADVWDQPPARHELLGAAARDLHLAIEATDERGRTIESAGGPADCPQPHVLRVPPTGPRRGSVRICLGTNRLHPRRWVGGVAILSAVFVLWAVAGLWARRLARPLRALTRVARDLGEGKLESRVRLHHAARGEVGELGHALNEMAERIERQMADQRQLIAAVSHEMRSPLARLRLLVEIAREDGKRDVLTEIETELVEMDALVEDLLTGARLDFGAINRRPLEAREVADRAAQRLGADAPSVEVVGDPGSVRADPTLLGRAVGALLDNARKHGRGIRALRVRAEGSEIRFEVEDEGPGFSAEDLPRVFEPFFQGTGGGAEVRARGVGLGLAIVRRIAEAHAGRAIAENLPGGGARVTIAIPR